MTPIRRRGKEIPRLPLSAFTTPPNTGTSDTFQIPPTPSLVVPSGIADAHLHITNGGLEADVAHLRLAHRRAVVLSSQGLSADAIAASLQSLQSEPVQVRVLAVLTPFSLESPAPPECADPLPALTAVYDGKTPIAIESEQDTKDQPQIETPVINLRWALLHSRVVDLDIQGGIVAPDVGFYDSFVNLLNKAIESGTRTPIVLTNVLPPPLDSITPVVSMMNHPTYTTYRQRISLLSLSENVSVKLLPPTWVLAESTVELDEKREKKIRDLLKLFIVPVLEAFGFDRIIFGSSPAFAAGSPTLAENWYRLVLESFRELVVSQEEMDKIFIENAERVYGSA